MNKNKKLSLRLSLIAGLISLALLGSTAGTLAWYAYSRTVTMSYVGTSVASSSLLNVGLVDNEGIFDRTDCETYNLERVDDESTGDSVVFAKSRTGFSLLALQEYLSETHRAVDKLHPVTTGSTAKDYAADADFELYRSPESGETTINSRALDESYVVLPFAFRVIDESGANVTSKIIWLTDAICSAESDVENSVRMFVDGANRFLMQPASEENGTTKVGGLLDLVGDGFYDRDASGNEYCYGEFATTPVPAEEAWPSDAEHATLQNVNGVEDETRATTFLAKHAPGAHVPSIANPYTPLVQEHYGINMVKPSIDGEGRLHHDETNGNGIEIATTSDTLVNDISIGYATFTIFIEGWDHSVIDQQAGYGFNLELKFEIDRI